jgi:hypothetical protein
MSQKQEKRMRKMLRKEVSDLAQKKIDRDMNMFKPKPRFVPMWLWVRLIGIFIKVRKTKKQ